MYDRKHDPVTLEEVETRVFHNGVCEAPMLTTTLLQVRRMLNEGLVTTLGGTLPIGDGVREVSICVHSDTPVSSKPHLYIFA